MSIYSELEGLYVERGELEAQLRKLDAEGKTYGVDEEYTRLDDELYIVNKAITELEWKEYISNGGCGVEGEEEIVERRSKRRKAYAELRERYLMEVWKGEYNEISDTLDCYEESVVHYGEGVDVGFVFLIDELENYGMKDIIDNIWKIVLEDMEERE